MEFDDELDDGEAPAALLPPEDRLWRHPSEIGALPESPAAADWHQTFEPRFWTIVLVAGAIGALLGTGATFAAHRSKSRTVAVAALERRAEPLPYERVVGTTAPFAPSGTANRAIPAPRQFGDIVAVTRRVRPSIVRLETRGPGAVIDGSGVLVRSDGYLLTSSAVVAGATSITAILADGRRLHARTIGIDPETGVAVAKIDGSGFDVATLGSSTALQVGQPLVAIGSTAALMGGPAVSVGLIRELGGTVYSQARPPLQGMIATDTSVDPHSAGGAFIDEQGAVVGITGLAPVAADGSRAGFATPIEVASTVASDLMNTGRVHHAWLGIDGADLDPGKAQALRIDGGAVVSVVQPSSPATACALAHGDVITAVDGRTVASMGAMIIALRSHHPGETIMLRTHRGDRDLAVTAVLAERPPAAAA